MKITVIGSGFGGLSAAIRLQAQGHEVTIIEKRDKPGGRAYVYGQFVGAYGYDVTRWTEGFDILRAVHELKMTTWLMQNIAESHEIAGEYQARMRTLQGEPSPGWRPF